MRKLFLGIALFGAAGLLFGGHGNDALAESAKGPTVAYSEYGTVRQQAYWAKSYNHPHVIICVTKGDKSEAVYKIAKYAKAHRKLGYYWGGLAGTKYDKLCNR